MNKIIYILCLAFLLSLLPNSGFSQEKIDSLKVFLKGDALRKQLTTDTINKMLSLDSIQAKKLLEKLLEKDSIRHKLKTDTIKQKIVLDSIQTKKMLEKFMSEIIKQKRKTKKDIEYEIDGLIVARTISRAGRDFYDIFFSKWEAPKGVKNFIIEIKEKPMPQMGTEITLVVKEIEIFKEKLPPRYDIIEQYAMYGIYVTTEFLKNYSKIQKELNGEDLSGSGIF